MAVHQLKGPLCIIINASISEGQFPNSWKTGKITPIWKKKGARTDKEKYRPVSLLKSASKVLEIVINQQVLRYFEENHLLPKSQHGFRHMRSTFSAVAAMHETWLENKVKKGHSQAVTFFDLSAAFDTLSSDIFCSKIKLYGLNEKSISWFRSYLTNRQQVVMVEDAISEPLTINVGSPQGAILSPTIFIILISDIGLYTDSTIFGYADDTTSTISGNDIPMLVAKCEEEAKKIIDYMSINRLKANDDKTHVMMIKKGPSDEKLSFTIGNEVIQESDTEKLLGIHVASDLKWDTHLNKLHQKLRHSLFTLRRLKGLLPPHLLKKVADGIFMSQVRYGLPQWCCVTELKVPSSGTSSNLMELERN